MSARDDIAREEGRQQGRAEVVAALREEAGRQHSHIRFTLRRIADEQEHHPNPERDTT